MGREEVLEEIDRRIRRLEAQVELFEEQLEREEKVRKVPQPSDRSSLYYLLFTALWFGFGLFAVAYMHDRFAPGVGISLRLYALIGAVLVTGPVVYLLLARHGGEKIGLEERIAAAKVTASAFYTPLRKAVEEDDREAMAALADRLLNEPGLSTAVELSNEGDPKLMAYALYLYSRYSPELREEVEETVERLTNRPLRALLRTLIGE